MNPKFLLALLTLLPTTTFAQIKFAPEAGLHIGMQTLKTASSTPFTSSETSQLSPGFTGGLMLDIKVLRNLYIQTGAFYMFDNIRYSHQVDLTQLDLGQPKYTQYDRLYSMKAPLYIMYKSGFEGTGRFIAGIGPYASYIFAGNRVVENPVVSSDAAGNFSYIMKRSNRDIRLGSEPYQDQLRSWDYGVNACIGYQSNIGMYFRGYFQYGLANLDPDNTPGYHIRNWGFGISIGYLIGKDDW